MTLPFTGASISQRDPGFCSRYSTWTRIVGNDDVRSSDVLIAGPFWVRFRMASCCRRARFSRAKLHRPLSEALKKQNSKVSRSAVKSQ